MQVKLNKTIPLLLLWSTVVTTQPLNDSNHEIEGEYYEGDMMLTEEQKEWLTNPILTGRNGVRDPRARWPNRLLLFHINPKFFPAEAEMIRNAMRGIAARSCIRFQEVPPNARAYVNILKPLEGCNSMIGFRNAVQNLNLGDGCMSIGTIQHELLHAIGFFHQQSDPSRDSYVKINYQNIKRGEEGNFQKVPWEASYDFGVGYDYDSVMHYGAQFFSANGRPTIESVIRGAHIGSGDRMSDKDFLKLNRMYNC